MIRVFFAGLLLALFASPLSGQEPSDTVFVQDTLPPIEIQDTVLVEVPDTQWVENDTLFVQLHDYQDTLRLPPVSDTVFVPVLIPLAPDTVHVDSLDAAPDTTGTDSVPSGPDPTPEPDSVSEGRLFSGPAELPRRHVEPPALPVRPAEVIVPTNESELKGALTTAECGDWIEPAPGTYRDHFEISPECSLSNPVVFYARGVTIIAPNATTPLTVAGSGVRVVGLAIRADHNHHNALISMRGREAVLDSVDVDATGREVVRRCVLMNGDSIAIRDSSLRYCHTKGFDSQAILIYSSRGPILIEGNYLDGAGENIMLGGAGSGSVDLLPRDVTIRRNFLEKTQLLFDDEIGPDTIGTEKNLFEIKSGQRILFTENVMRGSWADGQTGITSVIKSVTNNSDPAANWAGDIVVTRNLSIDAGGWNFAGSPTPDTEIPLHRVHMAHNVMSRSGLASVYQTDERPRMILYIGDVKNILTENNVWGGNWSNLSLWDGDGKENAIMRNNAFGPTAYGFNQVWLERGTGNAFEGNTYIRPRSGWRDFPPGNCQIPDMDSFPTAECPDAGTDIADLLNLLEGVAPAEVLDIARAEFQ